MNQNTFDDCLATTAYFGIAIWIVVLVFTLPPWLLEYYSGGDDDV